MKREKTEHVLFQGEIVSTKRMQTGVCRITLDIYEQDIQQFQKLNSQLYYLKPINVVITPVDTQNLKVTL